MNKCICKALKITCLSSLVLGPHTCIPGRLWSGHIPSSLPRIKTVQLHFAHNLGRTVTNNLTTHFLVVLALPIKPFPLPGSPETARSSIQQQHHHKSREDPHDAKDRGMHKEKIQWRGRTALSRSTGTLDNSVPILVHCSHGWLKCCPCWMILSLCMMTCMMTLTPQTSSWASAHCVSTSISAASWNTVAVQHLNSLQQWVGQFSLSGWNAKNTHKKGLSSSLNNH